MAFAFDLVDDGPMRARIAADVTDVLDRLIRDNWWIIDVDGEPTTKAPNVLPTQQMNWSLIGYHLTGETRFLDVFSTWAAPSRRGQLRLADIGFLNRYAQHYGLNLAHENYLNLLRLSRVYADPDTHGFLVRLFTEQIHSVVLLQQNPWYTAVCLAEARPDDQVLAARQQEQIIENLRDFPPAPKASFAMTPPPPAELDPFSVFLVDLQQALPWLKDLIGEARIQALEAYPVRHQCFSGFMFQRSMWAVSCGDEDDPSNVSSGHDYLAPYWLASAYGILEPGD